MSRVEQIAKAVKDSINNIKDQPGISVNSPQFKNMIQKQLERFEEKEVQRQKERLEELQRQHISRADRNPKKRSNSNGEANDGTNGNRKVKNRRSKEPDADGFIKVLGRFPRNSRIGRVPPNEHDFYDGMPTDSNRYKGVRDDLLMSTSDEEYNDARMYDVVEKPSKFV